jgi:hypothetical protein
MLVAENEAKDIFGRTLPPRMIVYHEALKDKAAVYYDIASKTVLEGPISASI